MSIVVREFLESFEALPQAAKHEAAIEILRRTAGDAQGDLPEDLLISAADALFVDLDNQEAGHAAG